ncbi:hypothetical protein [Vulcanococcus sp.]|uniref:hypothetical protein n=1 Tax=Vulcanococcus sp. TaxID=2856995 RepID=UPI003F6A051F
MSAATDLVREHVRGIVTRGLDEYGNFPIQEDEVKFYRVAVDLLLSITDRIERGDVVSLLELKPAMVAGVFTLNFDVTRSVEVFQAIARSLYLDLEENGISDPDTVREYKKYEALLAEVVGDVKSLLTQSTTEYLRDIEGYRIAEKEVNLGPTRSRLLKVNRATGVSSVPRSRLSSHFTDIFDLRVSEKAESIVRAAKDINAITSDSKIPDPLESVDTDNLVATFAGEGKKIYADAERLYNFAVEFGGYEGSSVGAVDYQSRYYEYLMAMSYGKVLPQGVLEGNFGEFGEIYGYKDSVSQIPGLKFLEALFTTRSANQDTGVSSPVAKKYGVSGISDRYVLPKGKSTSLDFVSLALEAVYVLCLKAGDTVKSVNRSGFELQVEVLGKVFPSSSDVRERSGGVTGSIGRLLRAHRSLFALTGYEPDLGDFSERFLELSGLVTSLTETLRTAGFRPGGHIPSLDLKYYEPRRGEVEKRLKGIGFSNVEIESITGASSFSELLDRFAPITDSQDVISFFRAYDLTKLLYEFGGQDAIDRYVDFLYGNEPVIRLLELLDMNRSRNSKIAASKYSKLIGYIVPLTYAVDPEQLITLDSVLKRNNLDLFESISLLVQQGVQTVIKDKNSVSLLSGMVAQMVGFPGEYKSQQPVWNNLISQSAGNIGAGIEGLYDRAEGITPTELYAYLNKPSATSPLGQLLDGTRGGRLTSLLKYCNMFGLLYTLSPYKNSSQLVNKSAEEYGDVLSLLDTLETLSERLYVSYLVLEDLGSSRGDSSAVFTDVLVRIQNKEMGAFTRIISNSDDLDSNEYGILESPGVGNSRVANGIRVSNSLLPEEAALVSTRGGSIGIFTQKESRSEEGGYVRVAVSNLLANGIGSGGTGLSTESVPRDTTVSPVPDYTVSYSLPETADSTLRSSDFSPVSSCQRFGGTRCQDLGYTDTLCSKGYNKSLYPETGYGLDPSFSLGTVPIDRPLGSELTRNVSYASVPPSDPQRSFTVSGLTDLSRSRVLKDSEMLCAGFDDLGEYSACMNLLKCKRFRPPTSGKYVLEFCPSTLQGGRFRR